MSGYTKNIAVIKGVREGFSSDGNTLSGIIKVERYGTLLHAEVARVNFAPLTDGKYVTGITDGVNTLVFDGSEFEGESPLDTKDGFGALIAFVRGGKVSPLASAICGNFFGEVLRIKEEIESLEKSDAQKYEDEAIAEENYYEYVEFNDGDDAVCEASPQKEKGVEIAENEMRFGSVEEGSGVKFGRQYAEDNAIKAEFFARAATEFIKSPSNLESVFFNKTAEQNSPLSFAGGNFYEKVKSEVESVLKSYPKAEDICAAIEDSAWVKINYGGKKFYVFGVIFSNGKPAYLCYGVPATNKTAPKSMEGLATLLSLENGAYWIMYQDAATGAAIKVDAS